MVNSRNRKLMAESFLKNEATDLIDNKGLPLAGIRNEATVGGPKAVGGGLKAVGSGDGSGRPEADG